MSLLGLSKFVILSLVGVSVATPMTFSISRTTPINALEDFLKEKDCYGIDTESNLGQKLLVCEDDKYYLYNNKQNVMHELEDLKTQGNAEALATLSAGKSETLKITSKGFEHFLEGLSLKLEDSGEELETTSEENYCYLLNSLGDTKDKPEIFCSFKDSDGDKTGNIIHLTPLK
ncbi:hypothetical protein OVS_00200 [Mycoplasma ovis str. Michigan]|uniref:Uncharacterized protein n=1 Tax=Mycoplasma ovis str. Michigan TaxID=1415773 RepID=A0ABM5P187_9MOLU|nr:hypothetical protein [Mycoplasma ovis]AHC40080.1 hypothetical protein OVS_00200 [Mycoplasma ovis str. Michigan]